MLENAVINQEDAVEKYFCKEFEKLPISQMSKEETETFMKLLFADDEKMPKELEKQWSFMVLKKRFEHALTIKPDNRTIFWFWYIAEGNPGVCVMYAYYLQYKCKEKGRKELKFEDVANIYPMGFPTKSSLQTMWDKQKVKSGEQEGILGYPSDNLIDYVSASKSIMF